MPISPTFDAMRVQRMQIARGRSRRALAKLLAWKWKHLWKLLNMNIHTYVRTPHRYRLWLGQEESSSRRPILVEVPKERPVRSGQMVWELPRHNARLMPSEGRSWCWRRRRRIKKKKEKHKEEKFRSSNALALFITLFSPFLSTDDAAAAACLCWPNKSWQTENVRLNQTESTASSRPAPRATPTRILRQTICRSFWYKLLGTKRQTLRAFFCMAQSDRRKPAST